MADVKPRIKLDKKQAKKGDLVEVKALVSDVMDGSAQGRQRKHDRAQDPNKFACTVNGKDVFWSIEPAISANPYIQFKFRAQETGPVVVTGPTTTEPRSSAKKRSP